MRLLVVFGYSAGRRDGLHPTCAARVERAASAARSGDVVLVSGTPGEAEVMRDALETVAEPVTDPCARHTVDTALTAAALARELSAAEVVVVTSWWHAPRARLLQRLALGRRAPAVSAASAGGPWTVAHVLRELVCALLVPAQLAIARASGGRRRAAQREHVPDRAT